MAWSTEDRTIKLIGALYENAHNGSPDAWYGIFNDLAEMVDSGPGYLNLYLTETDEFKVLASNVDPKVFEQYALYYQFISPFREKIIGLDPGECFSRVEHCSDEDFEKTEIYQQYFQKYDVYQYEYHALYKADGITGGALFSRPKTPMMFNDIERNALDLIMPHLQRAFTLNQILTRVRRENLQMSETLSKIHQSILVLDRYGKVVFSNPAADRIIEKKDGISIDSCGTLMAVAARDNCELTSALEFTFDKKPDNGSNGSRLVRVSRPSGQRPLQMQISPFTNQTSVSYPSEAYALVFIYDPSQRAETAEQVLSDVYGLTKAESRIASLLAHGHSVGEACEMLDVSPNTARSHLKRIFSKTETNRQSELIQLIVNGPGHVTNG